jgi:hypothetical protein
VCPSRCAIKKLDFRLKTIWQAAVMSRVQSKQTLKLRLLALVLALALIWYGLNPAPSFLIRRKRDDEPPDEKKQKVEPQSMPAILPTAFRQVREISEPLPSLDEGEDDFEWPEFIDG